MIENYAHLFKTYPSGTPEHAWYRKVRREYAKGEYSAKTCIEIEQRTNGKVMARSLRPDLFKQLDHEQQFKQAALTWCTATTTPTEDDKKLMEALLKRYEGRDAAFYESLKAVINV